QSAPRHPGGCGPLEPKWSTKGVLVARIPAERLLRLLGDWQDGRRASARALQLALAEVIEGAHLPAGQQLPGQRDLAEALGIARGTVARTYAALVETGHLSAR